MIFEVTSLDEITKRNTKAGKESVPWNIQMLRGWGDEKENSQGDKERVA